MLKFFDFIGQNMWIIVLTIMFILFLAVVSSVVVKKLHDSDMSLIMIILYYFMIFAFWAIVILVALPSIFEYLISIY